MTALLNDTPTRRALEARLAVAARRASIGAMADGTQVGERPLRYAYKWYGKRYAD